MQQQIGFGLAPSDLTAGEESGDRFVYSTYFVPIDLDTLGKDAARIASRQQRAAAQKLADALGAEKAREAAAPLGAADLVPESAMPKGKTAKGGAMAVAKDPLGMLTAALKSEVGILFLDRTRVRPKGFVLGEHLQSLSLAPGEELVVEQRTFSKRETTYDEANETDQETDLELDQTLTTTLEEGLDRQLNHTTKDDVNLRGDLNVPLPGGVTIGGGLNTSTSVSDADTRTQHHSVKNTSTASSKVSAKYRRSHKTELRVSTVSQFENSQKRTIRNPNRYTPVDLHYFKVLQKLELHQERYGARLCWSPFVWIPGSKLWWMLYTRQQEMISDAQDDARKSAGAKPIEPDAPTGSLPSIQIRSGLGEAEWPRQPSTPAPPGGATSSEVEVDLSWHIPDGYDWDYDFSSVAGSLRIDVTPGVSGSTGAPVYRLANVKDSGGTLLLTLLFDMTDVQGGGYFVLDVTAEATFVPKQNQAQQDYAKAMAAYQTDLATWQASVDAAVVTATQDATKAWEDWRDEVLAGLDVRDWVFRALFEALGSEQPELLTLQAPDLALWTSVFDWDAASIELLPSWWAPEADLPTDLLRGATDILNASFARVHVPVRPGQELAAMLILFEDGLTGEDHPAALAMGKLLRELNRWRTQNLGGPLEVQVGDADADGCPVTSTPCICLGAWEELLPTDGTHLEVVQAVTTAADDYNIQQLGDLHELRGAEASDVGASAALKQVITQDPSAASITVAVTDRFSDGSGSPGVNGG